MAQPLSPSRRILRWATGLALLGCTAWATTSWWAGNELAHPARRPLQEYHREFLNHSTAHGVNVRPFSLNASETPCLLVEPLDDGTLGARGRLIRGQLESRGVALPKAGSIVGTLVLVHGRRGRKEDYLLIAERFAAVGFRSLIPDLPGHGDHPDPLATYGVRERALPGDLVDAASARFGFAHSKPAIMGISMGGAVTIQAVALEPDRWSSVAVLSTFDTLENVVDFQARKLATHWLAPVWMTGTRWVFESEAQIPLVDIRPVDLLERIPCPILVGHGTNDSVIPIELGHNLRAALPSAIETRWVEIPGADHDNVLITDFPIYATLAEWFLKHRQR